MARQQHTKMSDLQKLVDGRGAALKQSKNEITLLKTSLKKAESEVNNLKIKVKSLSKVNATLETQCDFQVEQNKKLQNQLDSLNLKENDLINENAKLLETVKQFEKNSQLLQAKDDNIESEKIVTRAQKLELKIRAAQIHDLEGNVEEKLIKLIQQQETIDCQTNQIKTLQSQCQNQQEENVKLERELKEINDKNEKDKDEKSQNYRQVLWEDEDENQKLRDRIKHLEKKVNKYEVKLDERKRDIAELVEEKLELEARLTTQKSPKKYETPPEREPYDDDEPPRKKSYHPIFKNGNW